MMLKTRLVVLPVFLAMVVVAGCGKSNSSKIVGKWRPIGGRDVECFEFFADGKMTSYFNMGGQLTDYTVSGNQVTIGPQNQLPEGQVAGKTTVTFPDDDHMDLISEYQQPGMEMSKQTIRFERVKVALPGK